MFGGALNEDAFISMMCQQSRAGRGVTSRWTMQILHVSKVTALLILARFEKNGILQKTEVSWRSNATKFYYYPTDEVWTKYHAKQYRDGYNTYLAAMMEA